MKQKREKTEKSNKIKDQFFIKTKLKTFDRKDFFKLIIKKQNER